MKPQAWQTCQRGEIARPMAVFDSHKAFTTLVGAGFTERQAQALLDVGREGYGALATKSDLQALELAMKTDLDARLRELELRLTLRLGGMVAAGVAIIAALELLSR